MPFPVQLLHFFDNASPAAGRIQASAADAGTQTPRRRYPTCLWSGAMGWVRGVNPPQRSRR